MNDVNIIDAEVVRNYLKYADLIPAVQKALEEYTLNASSQPLRTNIPVEKENGNLLTMPSYSEQCNSLAIKLLSYFQNNSQHNLPVIQSYIMLFDPDNGSLLCMMDGDVVTAMRTAAASVVATQALVTEEPKVLSVLGSGVQAKSHILALTEVYNFQQIKVWSRTLENVKKLCSELSQFNIVACETAEEAVTGADLVVTVTNSSVPVLKGAWLKPGCHINCVGACLPTWREVDDECMTKSIVYADSRESAGKESGDVILSKTEVYAEIGEILLKKKPVKKSEFTFFKSLGFALEDVWSAKLVWDKIQSEKDIQNH